MTNRERIDQISANMDEVSDRHMRGEVDHDDMETSATTTSASFLCVIASILDEMNEREKLMFNDGEDDAK